MDKFFSKANKKRDLSDQSNNGDDSKRQREVSPTSVLYSPSAVDEVFDENGTAADNLQTIMVCIKRIEKQVKDLSDSSEQHRIKGDQQLAELTTAVKYISKKFEEYELGNERREQEIADLKKELKFEGEKNDRLEQYTRRNCLLIHGVVEKKDEDTDAVVLETINEKLELNLTKKDLDRSHRVGMVRQHKTRPLIVKLVRYNDRRDIFINKKKFKDSGVSVTESLTSFRMDCLCAAREKHGFKNAWSIDGRIMYRPFKANGRHCLRNDQVGL